MRIQATILSIVGLLVIASGAAFGQASASRAQDQDPRSLRSRAAKARAGNARVVDLGLSEGIPPAIVSLKDAASSYSLFVVVPVTTETVVENGRNILTWYKLRILERLSTSPASLIVPALTEFPADIMPSAQPNGPDELMLLQHGGTKIVDGVTFTQSLVNFPQLTTGATYLCVLDISPDGRVALAPLSGMGIYDVTNNELLKPLSRPDHPLSKELGDTYLNSLTRVRRAIAAGKSNR
jgi:hypothetical protein